MNDSNELQSRPDNTVSSSNGRLSFSKTGEINLHLSEGAQNEITSQEEYVEISTEDEVGPSNSKDNGSIRRTSSFGVSLRKLFSLTNVLPTEDMEYGIVSEGYLGDLELSDGISIDNWVVFPVPTEISESSEFGNHDSPKEEEATQCPSFDYIACLVILAAFGILGVLTRYLLQKLFGPSVANVTNDQSFLYLDLPSNMVGSFLMGWFGIVFKSDISRFSNQLAIGLSTGYLGSLTTFSGWNQAMIDLSVSGKWVYAVLGFVIGLFLVALSIILGIWTAKRFRWLLRRTGMGSDDSKWRIHNSKNRLIVPLALLIWGGLWTTSSVLEQKEFENGGDDAKLWLACLAGPFGVWIRWWLARLNGHGLGKSRRFKWIPFGTLVANILAVCIVATLATIKKEVNTKKWDTIGTGIQMGLAGCLSTVSTFMAELHDMTLTTRWRACGYVIITIVISFGLGTSIYSLPRMKGYK